MKLSKLLLESGITPTENITDVEVTEIVTDSRRASLGCMFVCLCGGRLDGHRYVREAMLRGAVAVVIQKGIPADLPDRCPYVNVIEHENTRRAAAMLYSAWYGHPSRKLKIIGVTGTNGKTSVAHLLKTVFEAALYKCGLIGTVCCSSGERRIYAGPDEPLANMTTPDPCQLYRLLAFMAADRVEYVFMEVSSHALKLCKVDAIEFDTAIFTNLSPEHLDFHGSMEDYAVSKMKLFGMAKNALINRDDPSARLFQGTATGKVFSYSASENGGRINDFCAENVINKGVEGINYTLRSKNTIMKLSSPIPGDFTVYNTLCVAACALIHGIQPYVICSALSRASGVEGRMERVRTTVSVGFSVFLDYAHTPDALESLLHSVRRFKRDGQRIVLLFGCGGDRDKTKRPVMGRIAASLADLVIVTSDNSRGESAGNIISEILSGIGENKNCTAIVDRREAIDYVIKNAREGDIILLAGKGHEKYEIDSRGKRDFDEKKIVVELTEKYYST